MDEKELQEYLHTWARRNGGADSQVETGKTEAEKYIQSILEQQRLQLEAELTTRGFEGSASEIDLFCVAAAFHPCRFTYFYRNQGC